MSFGLLERDVKEQPLKGPAFWKWVDERGGVKNARVNGYGLRYIDLGSESDRPLLLLHGFVDTLYTWHLVAPGLLQSGFRVIAVDLPGFGASAFPPDYDYGVESMAGAVIGLMDELGIGRFLAAGNSMGGAVCLYLALEYAERLWGMALLDPACYPMPVPWVMGLLESRLLGPFLTLFINRAMIRHFGRGLVYDAGVLTPDVIDELVRPLGRRGYRRTVVRTLRRLDSPDSHAMSARFSGEISTPSLILWGEQDQLIPVELGRRLQADIEGSRLVVFDKCGHAPQLEFSGHVVGEMAGFWGGKALEGVDRDELQVTSG